MCEVVLYTNQFADIKDIVKICELKKTIKKWAVILHDKDILETQEKKKEHYHLILHFGGVPVNMKNICKWFNIQSNQIEKIKGRWKHALLYLTHKNAEEKYQYKDNEVIASFDYLTEIDIASKEENINSILGEFATGVRKEYQLADLNPLTYIKYKTQLEKAISYFWLTAQEQYKTTPTKIKFITGDSGIGKTTFARNYCAENNLTYCMSGSSNDPLQDYKGQDVLILDDLRDDTFDFIDLLKMLDPYNRTSIKSRFRNKFFAGKEIIITSMIDIREWYTHSFGERYEENIVQLYRRISDLYVLGHDVNQILNYDLKQKKWKLKEVQF